MKFSKFIMVFVLTLTLVFGSSLAAYAYELAPDVIVNIPGSGEVEAYVEDDVAYLSVTPFEGYRFIRWQVIREVNGVDTWTHLSRDMEYQFELDRDEEIRAYLSRVVNLTVTINGEGDYTMINKDNGTPHYGYHLPGEYLPGEVMITTPEAADGYHFVNWVYNGVSSTTVPFEFTMPNTDAEIILNFAPDEGVPGDDEFTVSGTVAPVNSGTIAGLGLYTVGEEVTLTATPNSGYIFDDWTYNSEAITATIDGDEITFTMPEENVAITANFIADATVMATVRYINNNNVSIQPDAQIALPVGSYNQSPPAISGYQHVYSLNNIGTIMEDDEPFVITHIYIVPPAPEVITNTVTETVFVNVPATTVPTTEATTEATTEDITEEETPLGLPVDLDLIFDVPEMIGEEPMPTTDEVVLDEDVPLGGHLPATGQMPSEMIFGIGSLISAAGLWLKRKK